MKKSGIVVAVCTGFLFVFLLMANDLKSQIKPSEFSIVKSNTAFALDLYQELKRTEGNLFISPISISTTLAMSYAGARANTAKEMAKVLRFKGDNNPIHRAFAQLADHLKRVQIKDNIQLYAANSLWPEKGLSILHPYRSLLRRYYRVDVMPLDFKKDSATAEKTINRWVKKETKGQIKQIFQPGTLTPMTRLVLVNAVYFKGKWASQFDTKKTEKDAFHLLSGKTARTTFMAQEQTFAYAENDFIQILALPYKGKKLSMIVLLPKTKNGLTELENNLNLQNLTSWTAKLVKCKVKVYFPKFRIRSEFRLENILSGMGMRDAFSQNADFSGIDGRVHGLYIGQVCHQSYVEVNEEGTEAVAASSAQFLRIKMGPSQVPVFRADHPFLFYIRDNATGTILFLGRMLNPNQE